jgi:hypothetical protein
MNEPRIPYFITSHPYSDYVAPYRGVTSYYQSLIALNDISRPLTE